MNKKVSIFLLSCLMSSSVFCMEDEVAKSSRLERWNAYSKTNPKTAAAAEVGVLAGVTGAAAGAVYGLYRGVQGVENWMEKKQYSTLTRNCIRGLELATLAGLGFGAYWLGLPSYLAKTAAASLVYNGVQHVGNFVTTPLETNLTSESLRTVARKVTGATLRGVGSLADKMVASGDGSKEEQPEQPEAEQKPAVKELSSETQGRIKDLTRTMSRSDTGDEHKLNLKRRIENLKKGLPEDHGLK